VSTSGAWLTVRLMTRLTFFLATQAIPRRYL